MIRLKAKPTFAFKVDIMEPGEDSPSRVTFIGKHKRQSELTEWAERAKDMKGQDAPFLLEAIAGWEGVCDEQGKAIPFTADDFAEFLDIHPGSGFAIFQAFVVELSATRKKN